MGSARLLAGDNMVGGTKKMLKSAAVERVGAQKRGMHCALLEQRKSPFFGPGSTGAPLRIEREGWHEWVWAARGLLDAQGLLHEARVRYNAA